MPVLYDHMVDTPAPDTITPSYVPLHRKNGHCGDCYKPSIVCEGLDFIGIYGQNGNYISNSLGLKYDQTIIHMKDAEPRIFAINETHTDKMNVRNNTVLTKSRKKLFQPKDGNYYSIVSSSSLAPIIKYTKPSWNMMGITGPLVCCIRRSIEDKYGRWCGFVLLGKDNREILVLISYNVPQDTPTGDDTLHAQQTLLYLLGGEYNPNQNYLFVIYSW